MTAVAAADVRQSSPVGERNVNTGFLAHANVGGVGSRYVNVSDVSGVAFVARLYRAQ